MAAPLSVLIADIADGAVKAGIAFEGPIDAGLRLVLPQGIKIAVGKLHEALEGATIPAEDANGEPYEISAMQLLRALVEPQ